MPSICRFPLLLFCLISLLSRADLRPLNVLSHYPQASFSLSCSVNPHPPSAPLPLPLERQGRAQPYQDRRWDRRSEATGLSEGLSGKDDRMDSRDHHLWEGLRLRGGGSKHKKKGGAREARTPANPSLKAILEESSDEGMVEAEEGSVHCLPARAVCDAVLTWRAVRPETRRWTTRYAATRALCNVRSPQTLSCATCHALGDVHTRIGYAATLPEALKQETRREDGGEEEEAAEEEDDEVSNDESSQDFKEKVRDPATHVLYNAREAPAWYWELNSAYGAKEGYAVSGTDLAYGTARSRGRRVQAWGGMLLVSCPICVRPICVRPRYALSGTHLAHRTTAYYQPLLPAARSPGACAGSQSTSQYGLASRYRPSPPLRMSGTGKQITTGIRPYAPPMRCPVLSDAVGSRHIGSYNPPTRCAD
eukprot:3045869-Rhodomonas_salina.2